MGNRPYFPPSPERSAWFKQLACSSHTGPILSCESCFDKMLDRLELVCQAETAGSLSTYVTKLIGRAEALEDDTLVSMSEGICNSHIGKQIRKIAEELKDFV